MTYHEHTTDPVARILIVERDARVRRGLRSLIEAQGDMMVIGEASTAADALQCAVALHPTIVVLDLTLPTEHDGLAALRHIAIQQGVCVATCWHGSLRGAALDMGARAFIEKGTSPQCLLAAIRSAGSAPSLSR